MNFITNSVQSIKKLFLRKIVKSDQLVYGKYHKCRILITTLEPHVLLILFCGYKTMRCDTTFTNNSYYIHNKKLTSIDDESKGIKVRMRKWQ